MRSHSVECAQVTKSVWNPLPQDYAKKSVVLKKCSESPPNKKLKVNYLTSKSQPKKKKKLSRTLKDKPQPIFLLFQLAICVVLRPRESGRRRRRASATVNRLEKIVKMKVRLRFPFHLASWSSKPAFEKCVLFFVLRAIGQTELLKWKFSDSVLDLRIDRQGWAWVRSFEYGASGNWRCILEVTLMREQGNSVC